MNSNNSTPMSPALKCCVDYCETTYSGSAGPVVNTYACNQQGLTTAAMWQIHQERKSSTFSKTYDVVADS